MRIRSAIHLWLAALAITAVALNAPVACAQDDDERSPYSVAPGDPEDFARAGAFVGLGFNWQVPGFQGELRDQGYGNSWGFNARGGYRFYDWLAAEAIVEYADKFGPNALGASGDNLSLLSTTVNGKFIIPLERFQPYLSAGIGFLYADEGEGFVDSVEDRDFGFVGRLGGGIDFYLTRHWSIFVDNSWTMSTDNTEDLYFYSLGGGARYNF
jgi:opacity protein-like surface antigen